MKKIVRLTESELTSIIKRVIKETDKEIISKNTVTKGLNPIGTQKSGLNLNIFLNKGMNGAEVKKLQEILNRIDIIDTGKKSLALSGVFDDSTENSLNRIFKDIGKINLYKAYAALFAKYYQKKARWSKDTGPEKWTKIYQDMLNDPKWYSGIRNQYFATNQPDI